MPDAMARCDTVPGMWLNTATGKPVPETEVHQISPGVHVQKVRVNKVQVRSVLKKESDGTERYVAEEDVVVVLEVRGHVVQVPDGTAFDPKVHNPGRLLFESALAAQKRELHSVLRGGEK